MSNQTIHKMHSYHFAEIKENDCDCAPDCSKITYDVKTTMASISDGMGRYMIERLDDLDIA